MGTKHGTPLVLLLKAIIMLEFDVLKCLPYTCRDWLMSPSLGVHVHVTRLHYKFGFLTFQFHIEFGMDCHEHMQLGKLKVFLSIAIVKKEM